MPLLEPNRHSRRWGHVTGQSDRIDVSRVKALAEDAREQVFLADEELPDERASKGHMRKAGTLIGQLLQDLQNVARYPL
jgi:hypothetical protein